MSKMEKSHRLDPIAFLVDESKKDERMKERMNGWMDGREREGSDVKLTILYEELSGVGKFAGGLGALRFPFQGLFLIG